jgi:hypothetical protein
MIVIRDVARLLLFEWLILNTTSLFISLSSVRPPALFVLPGCLPRSSNGHPLALRVEVVDLMLLSDWCARCRRFCRRRERHNGIGSPAVRACCLSRTPLVTLTSFLPCVFILAGFAALLTLTTGILPLLPTTFTSGICCSGGLSIRTCFSPRHDHRLTCFPFSSYTVLSPLAGVLLGASSIFCINSLAYPTSELLQILFGACVVCSSTGLLAALLPLSVLVFSVFRPSSVHCWLGR